MPRTAIVAAMEREVEPLIRNWSSRMIERDGRKYRLYERGGAALVCGGIGAEAARRAAEVLIEEIKPARVLSVGFAGALDDSLHVGQAFEPRIVVNARDGSRTDTGCGEGVLVTAAAVAGKEQKMGLAKAYGASAVDMEAAAVAQAADVHRIGFGAVKAISDAVDFALPVDAAAMSRFVAADGTFCSGSFAMHVAVRPWLWRSTMALARNSARASRSLCRAVATFLQRERAEPHASSVSAVMRSN